MSIIGNMDDIPLNFDMMGNRRVDMNSAKAVHGRGTAHEKTRFTSYYHAWLTERN